MKNLLHFVCFAILFVSCSEKEDVADCIGVIDFIGPPSFQLKFVDDNENNLIENGYFDSNLISATLNSFSYDNQIAGFENQSFQNSVVLPSGIGNEGENTWILRLSESEIDTLRYSLVFTEVKQNGFCGTESFVKTASYNGNAIDLKDINSYCLTIHKTTE